MPTPSLAHGPAFERLGPDESWQLLATHAFGRICFCAGDRTQLVLTAYLVQGGTIYFRASAFGAVARQVESRPVTLQVDDMCADSQASWSVTFTGTSHRVVDAATQASLWSPVRPHAWDTGGEGLWIALEPDEIQGQRVRS